MNEIESVNARTQPRGARITYAEVDGERVCITDSGEWCERRHGHDGPHVLQPEPKERKR